MAVKLKYERTSNTSMRKHYLTLAAFFNPHPDFTHPGSRISDPGSRIPDPKTATKDRGEKIFFVKLMRLVI
jgi:hypothetical protein